MPTARARNHAVEPSMSLTGLLASVAAFLLARPRIVAGTVAFAAVFSFFAGNALYSQSQHHPRALFSTRTLAFEASGVSQPDPVMTAVTARKPQTRVVFERDDVIPAPTKPVAQQPAQGDETVARVQGILQQLGLYDGTVDGLTGPQTSQAVRRYQEIVGLPQSGEIDVALLEELTRSPAIVSAIPTPRPTHAAPQPASSPVVVPSAPAPAPQTRVEEPVSGEAVRIARIQAGLRAFGHDRIEIDGIAGAQTRDAIAEFQSLFRLVATGLADAQTEAKMREIGLIN